MAFIFSKNGARGVKLYTIGAGEVVTPCGHNATGQAFMVMPTEGRRLTDQYTGSINVVDLSNGKPDTMHGSSRVVHHKGAAIILDYVDTP